MYLQDGEILQDIVHQLCVREILQFVDEADHVLTQGGLLYVIDQPSVNSDRGNTLKFGGVLKFIMRGTESEGIANNIDYFKTGKLLQMN